MMVTKSAEEYLEALAESLEISKTRYDQAYERYHSLGRWLNRAASSIKQYNPKVYAQGSFALGTVIKPRTDAEEYDVDLVCEMERLSKSEVTQAHLKHWIRDEIDGYRVANNMDKPLEERRRCWALNYADDAQFHLDIVPAVPNSAGFRFLLDQGSIDARWANTAIGITDNEADNYNSITEEWPRANPKGYVEWFKSRMKILLEMKKTALAKEVRASVEDIPDYLVTTPLQAAIMILKRHRDIMFSDDKTNSAPISIIITTLAGHSYRGEEQVAEALFNILSNMDKYFVLNGQNYEVPNPCDPSENFADKWPQFPERRDAFFRWLGAARVAFQKISELYSRKMISEAVAPLIGQGLAKKAEERISGKGLESLLKKASAASAASAASIPSFGSEPRIPTKPKGFA